MGVGAVILAAGGSSRMGRPKQLLPYHGRSLLRHAAAVALAGGCEPVVVVLGAAADQMRTELEGLAVTVAENPDWSQGPGASVRAGLASVGEPEAVVFLLCDQPLIDEDHVRRLIGAWRETGRPMVASGYDGTFGVPALFARETFPRLRTLDPASGAKRLLVGTPEAVAVVPFPAGAIDLDTPGDYERFRTDPAGS
jgi:molybdenum cofactor cytidylyltransferase